MVQSLEERALLAITIQLDYSLDANQFFNTQAKRDLIQLAANTLASNLNDSLTALVSTGGNTWSASVPDPSTGTLRSIANLNVPANTIIVYVGGYALPGTGEAGDGSTGGWSASGDQSWLNTVAARGQSGALAPSPTDFGPWGGSIAFDTRATNWYFGQDASGLGANQTDFLTVAEHEIGHVLGLGTSNSWQTDVSGSVFVGPASEAAHGGQPVPLSPDKSHWAAGTTSDGHPAAMDSVLFTGARELFTTLDYAGLQDVGWQFQPPPAVQFSVSSSSVAETAGAATVTVTRAGGGGTLTVNYATADGSARAGVDYTGVSGTLVFGGGDTSKAFLVPLLNNPNAGVPVTVNLSLSAPTGGAVLGVPATATLTINPVSSSTPPNPPQLAAQSDTGTSSSDGTTRMNGSAGAPLIFTVNGVNPANGFVRLYDGANLLAGPVQATGGTATFTVAGTPLADGAHAIAATVAPTASATPSALSAPTAITIQTSLHIVAMTPANGSYAPSLPNGQIVVTFSHPLLGLVNNTSPITAANPFVIYLLARGPSTFLAAPSGIDAGNVPLHTNMVYQVNPDGTSKVAITPTEPLGTDIYVLSISGSYTDLAGNVLTDGLGNPGIEFPSFLIRPPSGPNAPVVSSVSTRNGTVAISNNLIPQPDTIAITFSKPMDYSTIDSGTVQLVALQGGAYSVVPSAVAYSPTTQSAYLTPEAPLVPGTIYLIAVAGSISDDRNFPSPGVGLATGTYYDTFTVSGPGAGAGQGPLRVARDGNGQVLTQPAPYSPRFNDTVWAAPVGYAAVAFTEPVSLASLGRYSAMFIPRSGGLDTNAFDGADVPLNAKLAFNPNTNQLIIVPTGLVGNDVYLIALSAMNAARADGTPNPSDPLTDPSGLPVYSSFAVATSNAVAGSIKAASAPEHVAPATLTGGTIGSAAVPPVVKATTPAPVKVLIGPRPSRPFAALARRRGWGWTMT